MNVVNSMLYLFSYLLFEQNGTIFQFLVPIWYWVLTNAENMFIIDFDMDIIRDQYNELESDILPVEVVQPEEVSDGKALAIKEAEKAAVEREKLKRKLEMAEWAEEKKLLSNTPPRDEDLDKIYDRLRDGLSLQKAIKGVCSYYTWCKWKEEYPVIMAMEDEARQQRIWDLQEKQRRIADGEGMNGKQVDDEKDTMRRITRAKLRIDTYQQEINRYDRLTEMRNGKVEKNSTLVPIQINGGYGRKQV